MVEERTIRITDGNILGEGSWVYAWVKCDSDEVVYVGATGLPVEARTWLHLHDENPDIGRIRSEHPEALIGDIKVRAFRIHNALDRQAVKHALTDLVQGLEPSGDVGEEDLAAARDIASRLTS